MSQKHFSADVEQLIQLVTHSIYSNKEIFIRELVSNANDAIQKAKFRHATDSNYLGENHELKINISIDKNKKQIIIKDNGIGMTSEEVEKNIGTIAKSGTKEFLEKIKANKESVAAGGLIGQFGIGFYSAFMVADKVELETKSNDSPKATLRTSEGKGTYEMSESNKTDRGTEIRMTLKDDELEFLDEHKIRSLIEKYSNYVPVAIMMPKAATTQDDISKDKDNDGKENSGILSTTDWEQVNKEKAIWTKSKQEVTKEEYNEFYKSISFDFQDYLDQIHVNIEGNITYRALMYIPREKNPFANIMDPTQEYGLTLYVQSVLVIDKCKELLPTWLRFIKGVVETSDISLNVSRELIQNSQVIAKIKNSIVSEVIKDLEHCKTEKGEDYEKFFMNYGTFIKEGIYYETAHKERIAGLVKFYSLTENKLIFLQDYIDKASDKYSKKIYYIVGKSLEELKSNPYIHDFKNEGIDVLLMDSPVDELIISNLLNYKEFTFQKASSQNIKTDDNKKEDIEKATNDNKDFLAVVLETIGNDKLDEINLGNFSESIPAKLITQDGQPSPQMEKIMKSMGQDAPKTKRNLELNLNSPIVKKALEIFENDKKEGIDSTAKIKNYIQYFYDQSIILEGGDLDNTNEFLKRINDLLTN